MFSPSRMSSGELAALCRRVGTSLSAGVDARKTWQREAERARGGSGRALEHITTELGKGRGIDEVARETGETFPPIMHDMLRVGEQTGHGDQVLLKLAEHFENMGQLRRIFLTGIIWPMIQLGFAIMVISLLIFLNKGIRSASEGELDLIGFGLEGTSGVIFFLTMAGIFFFTLFMLIYQWSRGRWGARQSMKFLGRVPILGECLQTLALGRMAWTLSLTTNTAMDVNTSLQSALMSTGHPVYMGLQKQVTDRVRKGDKMFEALGKTREFPVDFLDSVEVGEETGKLSESMQHLSMQYTERSRSAAKALTVFASFAVWGMVALMIALVVIRVVASYAGFISDLADGL